MARAVMNSMMAKIDELKEQMTDGAYLALCDELMRLHASTPPEAPATPPLSEREREFEEDVMRRARALVDLVGDDIFDLNDPAFIERIRASMRRIGWVPSMRLNPPEAPATPPEAPATPPISEEDVMRRARDIVDLTGDDIYDLNDPAFIEQVRASMLRSRTVT
jgi:hypothetical protein